STLSLLFSFFNAPTTPHIYTLSLHDALPIFLMGLSFLISQLYEYLRAGFATKDGAFPTIFFCLTGLHGCHVFVGLSILLFMTIRSEEHTSELQSPYDLVCRLLLEKKNRHTI